MTNQLRLEIKKWKSAVKNAFFLDSQIFQEFFKSAVKNGL